MSKAAEKVAKANPEEALISGYAWGGGDEEAVALTFSFPSGTAWYPNSYGLQGGIGEWKSWSPFSAVEQDAVRAALGLWAAVADVTFTEVAENGSNVGDLRFAMTKEGSGELGHAYYPSPTPAGGDVWMIDGKWHDNAGNSLDPGVYDFTALLHEIGHALGLKHSFDGGKTVPKSLDSYAYTVMSYSAYPGDLTWSSMVPTTPMYYDILALRELYGTVAHNQGNTTYTYQSGADYWETIVDTGGEDTIVYDSASGATIDLRERHWSTLGNRIEFGNGESERKTVCIGPDTVIENATGGAGGDSLIGNGTANTLDGRGGNDRLNGKKGSDELIGGSGADRFVFDTRPGAANINSLDFSPGEDVIKIDADVFKKVDKDGVLSGKAFFAGPAAGDASDRIGYDASTGALLYDKNGDKAGGVVQFASVATGLSLSAGDFVVMG